MGTIYICHKLYKFTIYLRSQILNKLAIYSIGYKEMIQYYLTIYDLCFNYIYIYIRVIFN